MKGPLAHSFIFLLEFRYPFPILSDRGRRRLVGFVHEQRQDADPRLPSRPKVDDVDARLRGRDITLEGGGVDSAAAGIDGAHGAGDLGLLDPVDTEVY